MRKFALILILFGLAVGAGSAQQAPPVQFVDVGHTVSIDPSRGADSRVDYLAMTQIGPWDDRNYQLTLDDLAVLAPNESELIDTIPVFFRVGMRRGSPDMPRTGEAQYPRSALQIFRQMFGGYLVNGNLYRKTMRTGGRFYIQLEDGVKQEAFQDGAGFVSGEVRVTSPNGGAESSIKINPADTNKVIAGSNGPGGGQKMHWSSDGGSTWTQVDLPLGGTCCDPTVDWSSDGQFGYAAALGGCGFNGCPVWFYRTDDFGQTWDGLSNVNGDPRREVTTSGSDKEFLHVDKYSTSPFKDRIYLTWHNGNIMQFAWSGDFGNTWNKQSFGSSSTDNGIGSDITTDSAGNIYYVWGAISSKTIRVKKSTNGGVSFGASKTIASTNASFDFPIPSIESRRAWIFASADTDLSGGPYHDSVYVSWNDTTGPESSTAANNHTQVHVAYSRDGGATWNQSIPHETADVNSVDRWQPWLSVGPDGTVYVAFYDTRQDPSRTSVDLYYSSSTDGAQTWSAPARVTTVISPNILDGFEFGDYNGLDMVMNDLIAIFTDNRSESGGTGDSVDVYGAGLNPTGGSVCGNDLVEPGEVCDGADLNGQTCAGQGCTGGGTLACLADCSGFDTSACSGCPVCNNDGVCDAGEDCNSCPNDCVSGSSSGAVCGNGVCETADGENCSTCAADCNGKLGGKPSTRYCCGDTTPCSDGRCTSNGNSCITTPVPGGSYCCGDGTCNSGGEDCGNCAVDCTLGPEVCNNGIDDDCANGTDCSDSACAADPACQAPACLDTGAACSSNSQCCSNRCKGRGGNKTCQ